MTDTKLVKRKISADKHKQLEAIAQRIHGTVPQVVEMAIDSYLKALSHETR